jgi:hypothetical protein
MNLKQKGLAFRKLVAGGEHSLAIEGSPLVGFRGVSEYAIEEGSSLWSFGNNNHGQLGLGHNRPQWTPKRLRYPANVVDCAAGERHSIAVTQSGEVWSFGSNATGATGHTDEIVAKVLPRIVMGGIAGIAARAVRAGGGVSVVFCDALQRDIRGKWMVLNARRRKYQHEENVNVHAKDDNLSSRRPQRRGWGRVKTFAKAQKKRDRERATFRAEQAKHVAAVERRKRRRARMRNRDSSLDCLSSSSDDEDEGPDVRVVQAALRRQHTTRCSDKQSPPETFLHAPRFFVPQQSPSLPGRTPNWLSVALEWIRNGKSSNVGGSESTGAQSDRALWMQGRIVFDGYDWCIGGRQTRKSREQLEQVRDSMHRYRKYRKCLVKAQALSRGVLVRIRVDLITLTKVDRASRIAKKKLASTRHKVKKLVFDLEREQRILGQRIADLQNQLGGRAYMLMKFTARQKLKKRLAEYQDKLEERDPSSKVVKLKLKINAAREKEVARSAVFEEARAKEFVERRRQRLIS